MVLESCTQIPQVELRKKIHKIRQIQHIRDTLGRHIPEPPIVPTIQIPLRQILWFDFCFITSGEQCAILIAYILQMAINQFYIFGGI